MGAPVLLRHPSSLEHDTGPHPERAARMQAIDQELEARGWSGAERVESPPASDAQLEAVHPREYVLGIEELCAKGGGSLDLDTVVSEHSAVAARHGAGGAAHLVDLLLEGAAPAGFSIHRPPGHHAETARAMGFCVFNNVAVAARHARDAHGVERVLVLDWDVHHGNGTAEIFAADPGVLFVSIHEWPLYPGTGHFSEIGHGEGEGYTVNVPVPAGTGDDAFLSLVEDLVAPLGRAYEPDLILVSAGFDAHIEDPLAGCRVTEAGYAGMTAALRRLGAELDAPVGAVLEGGYALGPLARSVAVTLEGLGGAVPAAPAAADVHPLAAAAVERAREHWPALV